MSGEILIPPNPARVSSDLTKRYDVPGPRYTSYPTAPHFTEDVDRLELTRRWKESNQGENPAGLSFYIHIPFCQSRCWFCGCFTQISKDPAAANPYLEALQRESESISRILDPGRPVRQLSIGGGTPNFLTPDRFRRMMLDLRSVWTFTPSAEMSVELDPRTVTDEHVDVLVEQGFNRYSMGVQDFNPQVLETIHRPQSREITERLVARLRSKGHEAINFDLIYGLPGQSVETMQDTARTTVELKPSRIALYSYAHVPWMKSHQKVLERGDLPEGEEKLALFAKAWDIFIEAGYVPVGMDHFARPEDELVQALQSHSLHRNFMGYTTRRGLDLVAFGVSGISSVANTYAQNGKDMEAYHLAMARGESAMERGYLLTREDAFRRELIIDIFCNFRLDMQAFSKRWDLDFQQTFSAELDKLSSFVADGIVELTDDLIQVTPIGRAFVRNVCMLFDAHLEQDASKRRYSRTV